MRLLIRKTAMAATLGRLCAQNMKMFVSLTFARNSNKQQYSMQEEYLPVILSTTLGDNAVFSHDLASFINASHAEKICLPCFLVKHSKN